MDIESLPSRNRINKMITENILISEEEFNDMYQELYLTGAFGSIGLDIFDRMIDIEYDDEEERVYWEKAFAQTFEDDLREGATLEIGQLKRQVRITLRELINAMRG